MDLTTTTTTADHVMIKIHEHTITTWRRHDLSGPKGSEEIKLPQDAALGGVISIACDNCYYYISYCHYEDDYDNDVIQWCYSKSQIFEKNSKKQVGQLDKAFQNRLFKHDIIQQR